MSNIIIEFFISLIFLIFNSNFDIKMNVEKNKNNDEYKIIKTVNLVDYEYRNILIHLPYFIIDSIKYIITKGFYEFLLMDNKISTNRNSILYLINGSTYQDKKIYMKFITQYPYGGYILFDYNFAEFYDEDDNLIIVITEEEVDNPDNIDEYIRLFNEFFFDNFYNDNYDKNIFNIINKTLKC